MIRRIVLAGICAGALTVPAFADPIEGNWRTQSGETAAIAKCGGAYCITLKTGAHAGKQIGRMNASGSNKYTGSITDPADDKTYSGSATLNGSSMKMKGCALKIFCKSQTWKKM
ncbi:DUF2147 domain-containing protein [Oricola thermophila]|uniref:DUF2147 domain-containing protein n=1 Tax=Oricola thermophila TaxID=2742145 RepID=A0A6N1VG25_9HYPH|nr:DUF2147 domain-containing protein [Oricola thermophila]QKV18585.1 DUF2147 domain-containing protein [Oricola thermophila]